MNVGVLGSGDVGKVLGAGLASLGHSVKLGTRDPQSDKAKAWVANAGERASAGTDAEAVQFGEIIVLATLWSGTEHAIQLAKPESFAGKVVIDATNPLVFEPNQPPRLALGHTDSGGEQVQRWLPDAHVVKAFNIVGNSLMVRPKLPGGPPTMFICGNNADAKKKVTEILTAWDWETIDLGGIEGARDLEPLCILWVKYGFVTGGWSHAFKMLHK